MSEPNWDRWHDLLDIRDGRGFTEAEQQEYIEFLLIVAKIDAEWARIGNAALDKLMAGHKERLRQLEELTTRLRQKS